jgi:iron complex outermembrane recepter protein
MTQTSTFRTYLFVSTALLTCGAAHAQQAPQPPVPTAETEIVIVTGSTSRSRTILTSSADVTVALGADLDRKASKSVAETLELIPGIFVEATAGTISNNYSVRGLQGGSQRFVSLEEDGMPIVYGGGGADKYFSQNLTIDRMEAVRGGSSGVLGVNGAGATINFISKRPNMDKAEGAFAIRASSYNETRADFYYSAPIADGWAYSVGGLVGSSPGLRDLPFNYPQWHLKAALERRIGEDGYFRVTAKMGDQSDAYYADMPYRINSGKVSSFPGLDANTANINGDAFSRIGVPYGCPTGICNRVFSSSTGVQAKTKQLRVDFLVPINESVSVFGRARYLDYSWDFNGLFPGSATGNGGLTTAVNYLTPERSPVNDLLTAGRLFYAGTAQFGLRNLTTGTVLKASDVGQLNALNGNGYLQRTTLNHDFQEGTDLGINVGGTWTVTNGNIENSLTVGLMYYDVKNSQNQSAVTSVVTDVRNNAEIYDIVAIGASGAVLGTVTDNGMVSYGDWGVGLRSSTDKSTSIYFNNEMKIGDKLRIDFGVRNESIDSTFTEGNGAAVNAQFPSTRGGVVRNAGSTWNGTYSSRSKSHSQTASTLGANYLVTDALSVYGRYAQGFQSNGVNSPATITLYEAGVRYRGHGLIASGTVFRTNFLDQFYFFIDAANPTVQGEFKADLKTNGVEFDLSYRPEFMRDFVIDATGVFQTPELQSVVINGTARSTYEGNRPERTPKTLVTITPRYNFPNKKGELYARFKYIGDLFADAGNGLALPDYWITSVGVSYDITPALNFNLSADNLGDVIGVTEGNPRQGQTQNATEGNFYGRSTVGRTLVATLKLTF